MFQKSDTSNLWFQNYYQYSSKPLPPLNFKTTTAIRRRSRTSSCDRDEASKRNNGIEVSAHSNNPDLAWETLKSKCPVIPVRPMSLDTPVRKDAARFVCIADTHATVLDPSLIPTGDVLIVAGNFTTCGSPMELKSFAKFLGKLPHQHKIVIAGNREMTFDHAFFSTDRVKKGIETPKEDALRKLLKDCLAKEKSMNPRHLLEKTCIYLEDELIEVFGISVYGSPWQPVFDNWAFNLPRGQPLLDKWNEIPVAIDILITNTPPLGHGDMVHSGKRQGCVELLNSVSKRIRPKYHVFGHIREGYGCTTDGYTKFINACICDRKMQPTNRPVIFDIALPNGNSKKFLHNSIQYHRPRSQTLS